MNYPKDDNLLSDKSLVVLILSLITASIWIYVVYLVSKDNLYADQVGLNSYSSAVSIWSSKLFVISIEAVILVIIAFLVYLIVKNHQPKKNR